MIPPGLIRKIKIQYVKYEKKEKKFGNEPNRNKLINISTTK